MASFIPYSLSRLLPLLLIAFGVSLSPIQAEDFWYHLSCGRAVVAGIVTPDAFLFQLANQATAPWLGGFVPYLVYLGTGIPGLALLKIVLCTAIIFGLVAQLGNSRLAIFGMILFLVTLEGNLDPLPTLFNSLCAIALFALLQRWMKTDNWKTTIASLLTVLVWANVARLSVVAIPLLCSVLWCGNNRSSHPNRRQKIRLLLLACAALCITPRGLLTAWDSARMLAPGLAAPMSALVHTQWKPLFLDFSSLQAISFLLLSIFAFVVHVFAASSWRVYLGFLVLQFFGWGAISNTPLVATLLMLQLANPLQKICVGLELNKEASSEFPSKNVFSPADRLMVLSAVCFALMISCGILPGSKSRLGWGLSPQLDIRMVEAAFRGAPVRGLARCPDMRSAGMLAWLQKPGITIRDSPVSALLEGRLADNLTVFEEIKLGWRFSKRDANAQYGGWWLKLRESNTRLLMVPNTSLELINSLEDTIYKPLSLDAPVLPYGTVDDRLASSKIHKLLHQRDLINNYNWAYTLPNPAGTDWFHNWYGSITSVVDRESQIRQVRVLHAMNLNTAALRMLYQLRTWDDAKLYQLEFVKIHQKLASLEQLTMGQVSLFRELTLQAFSKESSRIELFAESSDRSQNRKPPSILIQAIEKYVDGNIAEAVALLKGDEPEIAYMRAMLKLETGQSDESLKDLNQLSSLPREHPFSILGKYWIASLGMKE